MMTYCQLDPWEQIDNEATPGHYGKFEAGEYNFLLE